MSLSEDERKKFEKELKEAETEGNKRIAEVFGAMVDELEGVIGKTLTDEDGTPLAKDQDPKFVAEKAAQFPAAADHVGKLRSEDKIAEAEKALQAALAGGRRRRSTTATASSTA